MPRPVPATSCKGVATSPRPPNRVGLAPAAFARVRAWPRGPRAPVTTPSLATPSAGIGRTGCFIATRIGCQQLKARGEVDILGIVCQLRLDRWVRGPRP